MRVILAFGESKLPLNESNTFAPSSPTRAKKRVILEAVARLQLAASGRPDRAEIVPARKHL